MPRRKCDFYLATFSLELAKVETLVSFRFFPSHFFAGHAFSNRLTATSSPM
jgi:hypothetical protein